MSTIRKPDYTRVEYLLNLETGYYEKQPTRISFNKLPDELKVERTVEERIRLQGANEIIRGRVSNGKYKFFTGLIPINFDNSFIGNNYEFLKGVKRTSLIIFSFVDNDSRLIVFYFNQWYIDNRKERLIFSDSFLNKL
jgi:hypothetical protein